jgi:hypothetical protein
LVTKATELGYEPWYINKTPNGIYAFKLHSDSSKYEWTEDMLPATSTFGNGNKILKKVTYLDVSNAGDLI